MTDIQIYIHNTDRERRWMWNGGREGGERKHGQTDRQIDGRRRFQYYSAWVHAVKDIPLRVLGPTVVVFKKGKNRCQWYMAWIHASKHRSPQGNWLIGLFTWFLAFVTHKLFGSRQQIKKDSIQSQIVGSQSNSPMLILVKLSRKMYKSGKLDGKKGHGKWLCKVLDWI